MAGALSCVRFERRHSVSEPAARKADLCNKAILVTGSPGFIGAALVIRLLSQMDGGTIVSLDNMNDYYDVRLKEARLARIEEAAANSPVTHVFVRGSLEDAALLDRLFETYRFDIVVNLAAQAGVRHSIDHPDVYIESNVVGFFALLEVCRHHPVEHLVFASSSSVYGSNKKVPYSVEDRVDNPVSLYAATKKADELLAHAYAALYGIPCTGLRFFTVYGPFGRPDMAYFLFAQKMAKGRPILLYNYGDMWRDFTYIVDIVTGVVNVMARAPQPDADGVRCKVYNIGNSHPVTLTEFTDTLERVLLEEGVISTPAVRELLPMQPGDVYQTYADVTELERDFGFRPTTSLEEGLRAFARWFREYQASDAQGECR